MPDTYYRRIHIEKGRAVSILNVKNYFTVSLVDHTKSLQQSLYGKKTETLNIREIKERRSRHENLITCMAAENSKPQ